MRSIGCLYCCTYLHQYTRHQTSAEMISSAAGLVTCASLWLFNHKPTVVFITSWGICSLRSICLAYLDLMINISNIFLAKRNICKQSCKDSWAPEWKFTIAMNVDEVLHEMFSVLSNLYVQSERNKLVSRNIQWGVGCGKLRDVFYNSDYLLTCGVSVYTKCK